MKIAVVTGSAGGLGREFAERLLRSGQYRVCLSDVNQELGQNTCQRLRQQYGPDNVLFQACDVTSMEAVTDLWKSATAFFQTEAVDLWVNNAGVMGEKEGWRKCMDINLSGVLHGIDVATHLAPQEHPVTVVNVASILGLFNAKQPKGWAYNASKSAVVTVTRCLATASPHIRMLCLCPSVTRTPILQQCTAQEVEDMSLQVGGLMSGPEVGQAFETLLAEGKSGDVMALWKDCPPYYMPDTSMAMFIGFTTCAMAFRFVPSVLTPRCLRPWPHMLACVASGLLLMWLLLGQLTIWMGSVVSKTNG